MAAANMAGAAIALVEFHHLAASRGERVGKMTATLFPSHNGKIRAYDTAPRIDEYAYLQLNQSLGELWGDAATECHAYLYAGR